MAGLLPGEHLPGVLGRLVVGVIPVHAIVAALEEGRGVRRELLVEVARELRGRKVEKGGLVYTGHVIIRIYCPSRT